MTLRHFRILIAVVKFKSITAAAKHLYMSQPAVSLAIKEMEEYYGVKLFDRLSRRLFITAEGIMIYESILSIVKNVDDLYDQMQQGFYPNQIKLGASITYGTNFLPTLLKEYLKINPDINTTIMNSGKLIESVLRHELDLAIIEGPISSDKLISSPIINDKLVVIMNKDHHLAKEKNLKLDHLKDQPFLLREPDSGTRKIIDSAFLTFGFMIEPKIESTSTLALIEAVKANLGISIISKRLLDLIAPNDIISMNIKNVALQRPFTLIYLKNRYMNQSFKDLIKLIMQLETK